MSIKGIRVRRVLVAPGADIEKEFYLGAILDRAERRIVVIGSAEGGVEIEEVAARRPGAIVRVQAHPHLGLLDYQARQVAFGLGLGGEFLAPAVAIARGLVNVMTAKDADLVEVNPLAIVRDRVGGSIQRSLQCLDAKMTLDDSALPRHPDLEALRDLDEEDPVDVEARAQGISYIHLDGTIGCMVNGAGLAMATMDLVKRAGGEPANFLDIGGGARAERVAAAMRLILADPNVRSILVNIFGGIARGDEVARGIVEARHQQERHVPMVVRIVGTNAREAAEILRAEAFETATSLDEAVEKAVAAAHDGARDGARDGTRAPTRAPVGASRARGGKPVRGGRSAEPAEPAEQLPS
jgi:succinyl-CoA synthetase beta subunit